MTGKVVPFAKPSAKPRTVEGVRLDLVRSDVLRAALRSCGLPVKRSPAANVRALVNHVRATTADDDLDECTTCGGDSSEAFDCCPYCGDDGVEEAAPAEAATGFRTDLGNAQRLVAQHGQTLRYCHPWSRWFVFDGTRWIEDDTGGVMRHAKDTVRNIYLEAAAEPDPDKRAALAEHATASERAGSLRAMVSLASSEPGIPVRPSELDSNPWALNVGNGTLDLKTGKLRPHDRGDLLTKIANVAHDPKAKCPGWIAFLEWAMGGDSDMVAYLQRCAGYYLTGDVSEQALSVWIGDGSNGKSTAARVLQELLGDHAKQAPSDLLLEHRGERHPSELALLRGARLVVCSEFGESTALAEARIKALTGGDKVAARRMREDWWEFEPTHKLLALTNHRPRVVGQDHALWRRLHIVPWAQTVQPSKLDPHLFEKLRAELPGILNWALAGCAEWQRAGLAPPKAIQDATSAYRAGEDTVRRFLDDETTTDPRASAPAKELLARHVRWSRDTGEKPLTARELGQRLTRLGFQRKHTRAGKSWVGLRLKPENLDSFQRGKRGA